MTEASEFDKIYKLGVVPIPTNRPLIRIDQPYLVYRTEEAKYLAVVEDIAERHKNGQPVLVGTVSVEKSELLSGLMRRKGIPHSVLNAKQHESEAKIVALAGHKGAVTVATNMAGRGTDIELGGSVEFLADQELRKQGLNPLEDSDAYEAAWPEMVERIKRQVAAEHDEVKAAGGLYVLGTERHESRRIDNQLRGRAGRQGDPGESRFYLSLQDELMRLFKSDWVDRVLTTLKVPDDVPIENKSVTNSIASAQGQVESQNFDSRKNVLKYDDVMNRQREVIYGERRAVLEGADLHEQIRDMIDDVVEGYVTAATDGFPEEWDLEALWQALKQLYPVSMTLPQVEDEAGGRSGLTREQLVEDIKADAQAAYDAREQEFGEEVMRELERRVLLSVLDRKWREHLYEMDYLREGIGLRAYSQRDPLVEYQREGFDMFRAMMDAIKEEAVGYLFNLEVQVEEEFSAEAEQVEVGQVEVGPALAQAAASGQAGEHPAIRAKGLDAPKQPQNLSYSAPTEGGEVEVSGAPQHAASEDPYAGASRNAECPCGSGRKYKKCHGAPGGPTGLTTRVNG
jgi:preprotein translocase subunit SecA